MHILKSTNDNVQEYSSLMKDLRKIESDGVLIIDTGKCRIVNPQDQHCLFTLSRGDFFGESHHLKVPVS